jgi:plasmid segregation protein ParM
MIMSEKNTEYLGVDDGFLETKIAFANGRTFRMPSHAKAGELNQISINGSEMTVFPYHTSEGNYIAGEIRESDATAFDGYPVSALNRVIVSHAIRMAGVSSNTDICICSGLPVKKFYIGSQINKALIKNKIANLLRNDVFAINPQSGKNIELHKIKKNEVVCEGIAAWMDLIITRNKDTGRLFYDKELAKKRIAIVDIGGRTTDIAVIQNGLIDSSRSNTINTGMITVQNSVAEAIYSKFEHNPTIEELNIALSDKKIKLWGKWQVIDEIVLNAQRATVARIEAETKRCLGNAADLDEVVFVGGTTAEVQHLLRGWFANQVIGDEPGFANARGMQKYAEFVMSKV